jgi:hypothetical protein
MSAQDAANIKDPVTLLAKARAAFVANQARERYWNWATVENRSILDKSGKVIEKIPSVTVDSPIRSDGKRCNAVLAWGDGREPYLANATADERCTVEKEIPGVFRIEALFESRQFKMESRDASSIVLAIRQDKELASSADPSERCAGSVEGKIQLDAATFFPKNIDVTIATNGCMQTRRTGVDHYGAEASSKSPRDSPANPVFSGLLKGSVLQFEYELQRDKTGDATRDFWICAHKHSVRLLQPGTTGMFVSGRLFRLTSRGPGRRVVIDATGKAAELSAESLLKFEMEKDRLAFAGWLGLSKSRSLAALGMTGM